MFLKYVVCNQKHILSDYLDSFINPAVSVL